MEQKSQNEATHPAFDVEGYNTVVAKAELGFIRLKNLEFSVTDQYVPKSDATDKRSYDVKMVGFVYSSEDGFAAGTFRWVVKITREKKVAVKTIATYEVLYTGIKELKEDNVRKYVQRIGKVGAYPYFRALMSHLDVEAGTRLPPLPVLRA